MYGPPKGYIHVYILICSVLVLHSCNLSPFEVHKSNTTSNMKPPTTLTIECCLYRHSIAIELRKIIYNYAYAGLNNYTIKRAVRQWDYDPSIALLTYGFMALWDTSKVTDMNMLFISYEPLPPPSDLVPLFYIDSISDWHVSNVTDMNQMFMNYRSFNDDISN